MVEVELPHRLLTTHTLTLQAARPSVKSPTLHHRRTANSNAAHAKPKRTSTAPKPPRPETLSSVEALESQKQSLRVDLAEHNRLPTEEARKLPHALQPTLVVPALPQAVRSALTCQSSEFESERRFKLVVIIKIYFYD